MENVDGDEHYEGPAVDEGRHSNAQDARPRESENECDRAQTEAERRSNAAESNETWCDTRGWSTEEGVESPAQVKGQEFTRMRN
jgi:hypothetical protein